VLHGPQHDLHSGIHGGVAANPAQGLARLVATLHRDDGSIAVPGFYDAVAAPTPEERDAANAVPFDAEAYRAETGVAPVSGEAGFTPPERLGFRPTIDINGLHSGYGGAGSKTIIPATAKAKLTARLVPDQDPRACLDAIAAHLRAHTPPGLRLDIVETGVGGPGFRLPLDSPWAARARAILKGVTGVEPVFEWEGASIPIVSLLTEITGAQPLLVGFGRQEDRIHAPNESFSLEQFEMGFRYAAAFLASL
jgi:acetylornithine deacetylase/succinyl-diaminopimelate desuccinylase-like protein